MEIEQRIAVAKAKRETALVGLRDTIAQLDEDGADLTAVGTAVGEARSELEAADEEILQLSKIQEAQALLPAATEPPAAKVEPSAAGETRQEARARGMLPGSREELKAIQAVQKPREAKEEPSQLEEGNEIEEKKHSAARQWRRERDTKAAEARGTMTGAAISPQRAPVAQTGTCGFAIASMVLGILWIWGIGSVLALVFGYISRRRIDESEGSLTGRGMAIAGIVLGWIGVVALIAVIIAIVIAATSP